VSALSDSEVVGRLSTKKEAASTVEAAVYKPGYWSSALASDISLTASFLKPLSRSNVLPPSWFSPVIVPLTLIRVKLATSSIFQV